MCSSAGFGQRMARFSLGPALLKSASLIVGTSKAWIGINETPEELIFMGSELNIGTINGLTVDQILDKMANKGIGMYPGLS